MAGTAHSPLDAAGVPLMSPLKSSARAVLRRAASVVGYPVDVFRNYEKVHLIRARTAIVHGTVDHVVPCANGQRLHGWLQVPRRTRGAASATPGALSTPWTDALA